VSSLKNAEMVNYQLAINVHHSFLCQCFCFENFNRRRGCELRFSCLDEKWKVLWFKKVKNNSI